MNERLIFPLPGQKNLTLRQYWAELRLVNFTTADMSGFRAPWNTPGWDSGWVFDRNNDLQSGLGRLDRKLYWREIAACYVSYIAPHLGTERQRGIVGYYSEL